MNKSRLLFHIVTFLIALVVAVINYPSTISTIAITVACSAVFFYGPPVLFRGK